MSNYHFENIKIAGIAAALPIRKYLTTEHVNDVLRLEALEKFAKTTGIRSTYRTKEFQTASDLCFAAARRLLDEKGVQKETIGALIFVSQTADYRLPATSFVLQERLGLSQNCTCFDINLGCSGYVCAIAVLASLMKNSDINRGLLLVGDTCYKTDSEKDINQCLFGDAGTATILEKVESEDQIDINVMSDGSGFRSIIMPCGGYRHIRGNAIRTKRTDGYYRSDFDGYLDGTDIFSFSIREVPKAIRNIVEGKNKEVDEYDGIVLHQANEMIIKQIAKKLKISMEKVPITLDRYGNTSSASIPLTIADVWSKDIQKSISIVACGFGVGLSWSTMTACLNTTDILPIIFTDEYFDDGVIIDA